MPRGDDDESEAPVSVYPSGEQVRVWMPGRWQPAVVMGITGNGHVPAGCHRWDGGPAFPPSSPVDARVL
ncbi:MAG: hypothetical protein ACJ73E_17055 [Mycobacteriales bacterium]